MELAYYFTQKVFGELSVGGSHSLQLVTCMEIIQKIMLRPGDQVWDVGCGACGFAATMSVLTGKSVTCTDIDAPNASTFTQLRDTAQLIMEQVMQRVGESPSITQYRSLNHPKAEDCAKQVIQLKKKSSSKKQALLVELYAELMKDGTAELANDDRLSADDEK